MIPKHLTILSVLEAKPLHYFVSILAKTEIEILDFQKRQPSILISLSMKFTVG